MSGGAGTIVHAGLVALRLRGRWRGVLIEGPSGAGKSDLALRSLQAGLQLVADDRVILFASGGALYGRAPDPLASLLETRGLGILPAAALPFAQVILAVECVARPQEVERMPDADAVVERLGFRLPLRRLWPSEPAAPAKLRRALESLGAEL